MSVAPPGSRIALTGATGFVGGHLLNPLIDKGYRINALTRRDPPLQNDNVDWIYGDLGDPTALRTLVEGVDGVIHLAGLIKARRKQAFYNANVRGTWMLLDALRDAGQPTDTRFIHISSFAACEPGLSHYAASKAEAEETVRKAHPQPDWTILRAPGIYGPGDEETLFFFQSALSRIPILPGRSGNRTSLIHVHDFCRAIVTALQEPGLSGLTVDVHDGAPKGYLLDDVLRYISDDADKRALHIPGFVLQSLGALNLLAAQIIRRTPSLTPGKARELAHPDWVSTDQTLIEKSSWTPWIKAERGLPETRDWYQLHGYLK